VGLCLSYSQDDSYTPNTVCVRAGTGLSDLQDIRVVSFEKPTGWLVFDVYMEPTEDGEG
jgi:anaphase-promoting complex subunit 10